MHFLAFDITANGEAEFKKDIFLLAQTLLPWSEEMQKIISH